jgi:hypothetical protein
MATWSAVAKLVAALPGTVEVRSKDDLQSWRVKDKLLAWERPLRKSDLAALGKRAPSGDILAVYVPDLETKDALVTHRSEIYFTTPHFDGYSMVLLRLGKIGVKELAELLDEAWRVRAPKRLLLERQEKKETKVVKAKRVAKKKRGQRITR